MVRQLFVNPPVADLDRSKGFFESLGFAFNPQFTDENAACMVTSDDSYVMLLVESFFETFTDKPIADATSVTDVLVSVSAESQEAVDELVDTAAAEGASEARDPQELDFMDVRSFGDLDGHIREVARMDPDNMPGGE